MFCIRCGAQIDQDSVFCCRCGARVPEDLKNTVVDEPVQPAPAEEIRHDAAPVPPAPEMKLPVQCPATMFDKDVSGSMGFSKAEGTLTCYADHLEFKVKFGGSLSAMFGIAGVVIGTAKAKDKNALSVMYSEIMDCKTGKYALGQPAVVLRLKTGATISYVNGFYQYDLMRQCFDVIFSHLPKVSNDNIGPQDTAQISGDCEFVMKVLNIFSIAGQGTAANGRIEQGVVAVGDKVQITDSDRNIKTEHIISTIAAGCDILESTPQKGGIVSLLFADCTKDQLQNGDFIIKKRNDP